MILIAWLANEPSAMKRYIVLYMTILREDKLNRSLRIVDTGKWMARTDLT
jgi:hypothetical protein